MGKYRGVWLLAALGCIASTAIAGEPAPGQKDPAEECCSVVITDGAKALAMLRSGDGRSLVSLLGSDFTAQQELHVDGGEALGGEYGLTDATADRAMQQIADGGKVVEVRYRMRAESPWQDARLTVSDRQRAQLATCLRAYPARTQTASVATPPATR